MDQDRLKIEYGLDETFVTIKEPKLLEDVCIRKIQEALLALVEEGKRDKLQLNFSEVDFLSSSFLGCLVKVLKRVREKNGELTLINIDPKILKVFQITQLDKVFNIV